jgi:hypothetical protein
MRQAGLSGQARVSRLRARLDWLDRLLLRMEGQQPEPPLQTRMDALAITLMGLEGLTQRIAAGAESERAIEAATAMIRLRCAEADVELGLLIIDALGYYALVLVDPKLMHNEGQLGPLMLGEIGQGAIAESIGYVGGFEDVFDEWALKDVIARAIDI